MNERWEAAKAAFWHLFAPARTELTEEEQQSVDEQTRVRTDITRKIRVEP